MKTPFNYSLKRIALLIMSSAALVLISACGGGGGNTGGSSGSSATTYEASYRVSGLTAGDSFTLRDEVSGNQIIISGNTSKTIIGQLPEHSQINPSIVNESTNLTCVFNNVSENYAIYAFDQITKVTDTSDIAAAFTFDIRCFKASGAIAVNATVIDLPIGETLKIQNGPDANNITIVSGSGSNQFSSFSTIPLAIGTNMNWFHTITDSATGVIKQQPSSVVCQSGDSFDPNNTYPLKVGALDLYGTGNLSGVVVRRGYYKNSQTYFSCHYLQIDVGIDGLSPGETITMQNGNDSSSSHLSTASDTNGFSYWGQYFQKNQTMTLKITNMPTNKICSIVTPPTPDYTDIYNTRWSANITCSAKRYITYTVKGTQGTEFVAVLNNNTDITNLETIQFQGNPGDRIFRFAVPAGSAYNVTFDNRLGRYSLYGGKTSCTVTNGTGTATNDVSNVLVNC